MVTSKTFGSSEDSSLESMEKSPRYQFRPDASSPQCSKFPEKHHFLKEKIHLLKKTNDLS